MNRYKSIGFWLSSIHRRAKSYYEKDLSKFGLGSGTHVFLTELFHQDGINQQELSEKLQVDKATTTRAVKKLVELGYVKREKDKVDNRAYNIFLTRKAKEIVPEIRKIRRSWNAILSHGFTNEEKKSMLDLLRRMSINAVNHKRS
jgi:DNA-binding MarR family transcriptional regulator